MSIRSFYIDSITEGWTKKDWALNLIPLGGIASVAYEIGSAYLPSRNRTAKISEDFFKSPIQTTIKKIAQCLWVPIVVCEALKLVCLIVNACWNRCKKECLVFDSTAKDPFEIMPHEVVVQHIFSYLNLHALGLSRSVSKRWNEFASTPILWQSAVYREIAFSSKNWAQWDADIVKDVDMEQEMLSLPKNIMEELRRSAFPGKNIKKTHVLVRMLQVLSVKKLGEHAKKYFPGNAKGYRVIAVDLNGLDETPDELKEPADESVWLLMTKDVLPGSRNKSYIKQQKIVAELAQAALVSYEVPTTLEAVTCILAEYSRSENRLFSDRPSTYTRCQKNVQGWQYLVGGFALAGLGVSHCYIYDRVSIGVAALRKF